MKNRTCLGKLPVLALCAVGAGSVRAAEPDKGENMNTVRILTIGNSFTRNATRFLADIAEANGDRLVHGTCWVPASNLKGHARTAAKDGSYPIAWGSRERHTFSQALTKEPWDFVTIQQFSLFSFRPETYRPWAQKLRDAIAQRAPRAEVLLHMTWAYREDDPLFEDDKYPLNVEAMYAGVYRAYTSIAEELGGLRVIPVGVAFENARRDPDWQLDTETELHSLHRGTKGRRGRFDGHHANIHGEYLGSCVWYEFLFGRSVIGNGFRPKEISAQDAAILQRIAHQTVTEGLRPPLAEPPPMNAAQTKP